MGVLLFVQHGYAQRDTTFIERFDAGIPAGWINYPGWQSNALYFIPNPAGLPQSQSLRGRVPNNIGDSCILQTRVYDFNNYQYVYMTFSHICKVSPNDMVRVEYSEHMGGGIFGPWQVLPAASYKGTSANYGTVVSFSAASYPEWKVDDSIVSPDNQWWKEEVFDLENQANFAEVRFRFIIKRGNVQGTQVSYGWLLENFQLKAANYMINPPTVRFVAPFIKDTAYGTGPWEINAKVKSNTTAKISPPFLRWTIDNWATYDSVLMTMIAGDSLWRATIPQYIVGTTVYYAVTGKDSFNNEAADRSGYRISKLPQGSVGNTIVQGTGTSSQTYPFYPSYGYSRNMALYTTAEIPSQAMGVISSIGLRVSTASTGSFPIKIWLKTIPTATTTWDAIGNTVDWVSYTSDATLVYDGNFQFTPTGWVDIPLQTSYVYTRQGNLVVMFEQNCGGTSCSGFTSTTNFFNLDIGVNRFWQRYSDNTPPNAPGSGTYYLRTLRPDFRMNLLSVSGNNSASTVSIDINDTVIASSTTMIPIYATIKNKGGLPLDSVTVTYRVNRGTPVAKTLYFNDPLNPLQPLPWDFNYQDSLGEYVAKVNGLDTITVWVSYPNGVEDSITWDDTLVKRVYGVSDIRIEWVKTPKTTEYSTGPHEVTAKIISLTGKPIDTVWLYVESRLSSNTILDTLMMLPQRADMWTVYIPNKAFGSNVTYSIRLTDFLNNNVALSRSFSIQRLPVVANPRYVTVGTGTVTNWETPICLFYNYTWSRQIYTASEVSSTGAIITELAWDYAYTGDGIYNKPNQKWYFKAVSTSSFSSTGFVDPVADGATLVWQGSLTSAPGRSWANVVLDEPFVLPQGSNLMIYCMDSAGRYPGSSYIWNHTSGSILTGYRTIYARQDLGGIPVGDAGTRTYDRPNARFYITGRTTVSNSVAMDAIVTPQATTDASVLTPVTVRLRNYGSTNLDSCYIDWTWNGSRMSQVVYRNANGLSEDFTDTITIGDVTPNLGNNNIVVWVSMPNGVADAVTSDDTLTENIEGINDISIDWITVPGARVFNTNPQTVTAKIISAGNHAIPTPVKLYTEAVYENVTTYDSLVMNFIGSDLWTVNIPSYLYGTNVTYTIKLQSHTGIEVQIFGSYFVEKLCGGIGAGNGLTADFSYSGNVVSVPLSAGIFEVEMWGADGGSSIAAVGGKGGYSKGTLTVISGTTYYIHVGGKGADGVLYSVIPNNTPAGGYNGGGNGGTNSNTTIGYTGGGGGGATHIATTSGLLATLESNKPSVAIVAGGGGSGGYTATYYGGHGGGVNGSAMGQPTSATGATNGAGQGGTQIAAGAITPTGYNNNARGFVGLFGQGGSGGFQLASTNGGGGGGGGWYGGSGGDGGSPGSCLGGGGGSGYIDGAGISNAITIQSGQPGFVANPDASGNGFVRITFIQATVGCDDTNSVKLEAILKPTEADSIAGTTDSLIVVIKNVGLNDLHSCYIDWMLNGNLMPPFHYTKTNGLQDDHYDTVVLSTNYTIKAGINEIVVWVSMPNGQVDPFLRDDTLRRTINGVGDLVLEWETIPAPIVYSTGPHTVTARIISKLKTAIPSPVKLYIETEYENVTTYDSLVMMHIIGTDLWTVDISNRRYGSDVTYRIELIDTLGNFITIFGIYHIEKYCGGEISNDVVLNDNGTSSQYYPFQLNYGYCRGMVLYTIDEIDPDDGVGQITSVGMRVSTAATNTLPIKIWIKTVPTTTTEWTTGADNLDWAVLTAGATLVYDGYFLFAPLGWVDVPLQIPYNYDRTGNLVVMFEQNCGGTSCNGNSGNPYFYSHTTTQNRLWRKYSDNNPPTTSTSLNLSTSRPDMRLNVMQILVLPCDDSNSVAMDAIVNPQGLSLLGTSIPVIVRIRNVGIKDLDSCYIDWTLNGNPMPQVVYRSTNGLPDGFTDTITLDSYIQGNLDTIVAWVSMPNGEVDPNIYDDTLSVVIQQTVLAEFVEPLVPRVLTNTLSIAVSVNIFEATGAPLTPPYIVYHTTLENCVNVIDSVPLKRDGDKWVAQIPKQYYGSKVIYELHVSDADGNSVDLKDSTYLQLDFGGGAGTGGSGMTDTVTIGTGISSQYQAPINTYYGYSWSRQLYLYREICPNLDPLGTFITEIAWHYTWSAPLNHTNQTCYMRAVPDSVLYTGYIAPLPSVVQQVWRGTYACPSPGWWTVVLDTAFYLPPGMNLEIFWENYHGSYYTGLNPTFAYTSTPVNRVVHGQSDNSFPSPTTVGSAILNRPDIKITKEMPLELYAGYNLILSSVVSPINDPNKICESSISPFIVSLVNLGDEDYDFAIDNITISYEIAESASPVPLTGSVTINTGSIESGQTNEVVLIPALPLGAGTYEIKAWVTSAKDNFVCDDTTTSIYASGKVGLPIDENFSRIDLPTEFIHITENVTDIWEVHPSDMNDSVQPDFGTGMLRFISDAGKIAQLSTRQLDMYGLVNPILEFWYYHDTLTSGTDNSIMEINVEADGVNTVVLTVFKRSNVQGWKMYQVNLSSYVNAQCVLVQFVATNKSTQTQYIDRIRIYAEQNLALDNILVPSLALCDFANKKVQMVLSNTGQRIEFANNNTQILWEVCKGTTIITSGAYSLNSGFLESSKSDTTTLTTMNFDTGIYNIRAWISPPIDNNQLDDTAHKTLVINPDVAITAIPNTDMMNCFSMSMGMATQDVTIQNKGNFDIYNLPLILEIHKVGELSETINDNLDSLPTGITRTITISQPYTIPMEYSYNVVVKAVLSCDAYQTDNEDVIMECVELHDLWVSEILKPDGDYDNVSNTVNMEAKIKNLSLYDAYNDVTVYAQILDGDTLLESFNETINRINPTDSVLFTHSYTIPMLTNYTIKVFIEKQDANPANDTLTKERKTNLGTITPVGNKFALGQNVPNPANDNTRIGYNLPEDGQVIFTVYTITGQVLHIEKRDASSGKNELEFNTINLANGIYYYSMEYKGESLVKKMTIRK